MTNGAMPVTRFARLDRAPPQSQAGDPGIDRSGLWITASLYSTAGRMAGLTGMAFLRLISVSPLLRVDPFPPSSPIPY